jgi:hypothetical protein
MITHNMITFDYDLKLEEQYAAIERLKGSLASELGRKTLNLWLGITIHFNNKKQWTHTRIQWNLPWDYSNGQFNKLLDQWMQSNHLQHDVRIS